MSIVQSADKQGNPSFHIHLLGSKRRYPCTQTTSAVSKDFPLCSISLLVVASDVHPELESEKWVKNVDIYTANSVH